ncbi:MAG: hypothetical protein ACRDZ8_18730 [Acidimicrobiales bacterium]
MNTSSDQPNTAARNVAGTAHQSSLYRSGAAGEQNRLLNRGARRLQRDRRHTDGARCHVLDGRTALRVSADRQHRSSKKAEASRTRAEQEREAGRGRVVPRWAAWAITLLALCLLWEIDSTLLVTLLLGHLATILVTGVLVLASAVTAHLAGDLSREYHLAAFPAKELGGFKMQLLRFSLIAGPGIEIGLGILRAAGSGALISAFILALAGVAIWAGLALLAFASHSPLEDQATRDNAAERRDTRAFLQASARLNGADVGYRSKRDRFQRRAQRAVDEADIAAAQAAEHAGITDAVMDDLRRVAELRKIAVGDFGKLELPPFKAPEPRLALPASASSLERPEPLALPPAGEWR